MTLSGNDVTSQINKLVICEMDRRVRKMMYRGIIMYELW